MVIRIANHLRRFGRDPSGVSAVEFALILPVMLLLYFGGVEVSTAVSIKRKVTHLSSTVADLVTQAKTISATDMGNIFDIAEAIMVPYDTASLSVVVSGITIDGDGNTEVEWSDTLNGTELDAGSSVNLPDELVVPDTFLVMAEVHYTYEPTIGYAITGTFDISDQFYLRPRLSNSISWSDS